MLQKAVTITIGTRADASLRALARELAAARAPGAPAARPRSGSPRTLADARATSGPSSATPVMPAITTPNAVLAALVPDIVEDSTPRTTVPASASTPSTVRTGPVRTRAVAASPSAWLGRAFAGRRAAA